MAELVLARYPVNIPTLPEMIAFRGKRGTVNICQEIGINFSKVGILLLDDHSGARVKAIAFKHSNDAEQVGMEVFRLWLEGSGRQPVSWHTLINVLTESGLITLARIIEVAKATRRTRGVGGGDDDGVAQVVLEPTAECLTKRIIVESKGKFGNLLLNVCKKLQEKLTKEQIQNDLFPYLLSLLPKHHFSCIPIPSDVIKIFEAMMQDNLWNHLDFFSLVRLEQVIKRFVPEMTDQMEKYRVDWVGFRVALKIKDYIPKAKRLFPNPEAGRELKTKRNPEFLTELSVLLDECVSNYTLNYLEELWQSLASILRLPPLKLLLDAVIMNSVLIVWLFSTELAQQTIEIAQQSGELFRKHPILRVMIGDKCVFQADFPDGKFKEMALLKACAEGRLEDMTTLLSQGTNINSKDPKDGDTALTLASWKGHTAVVKELLAAQANVDMQDNVGNTALIKASREGYTTIVKELVVARSDVNLQNEYGDTALHWASYNGHTETVKELLRGHANVNIVNKNNATALMEACSEGYHEVANILISEGTQVDLRSERGSSALLLASLRGLTTTVKELLKKGVDINVQNEDGLTPLIAATKHNHSDVVMMLLDAEADTEITSTGGMTPLFFAAAEDNLDIVRLLLGKGAYMKAKNSENLTVLDIAPMHGAVYQELAKRHGHQSQKKERPRIQQVIFQFIFKPFKMLEQSLRSKKTEVISTRKTSWHKLFSKKYQQKAQS